MCTKVTSIQLPHSTFWSLTYQFTDTNLLLVIFKTPLLIIVLSSICWLHAFVFAQLCRVAYVWPKLRIHFPVIIVQESLPTLSLLVMRLIPGLFPGKWNHLWAHNHQWSSQPFSKSFQLLQSSLRDRYFLHFY